MRCKMLIAALLAALLPAAAHAQATQPGCLQSGVPCTSIAGFFATSSTTLSASTVSSNVAFPALGANLIATVQNAGAVPAYVLAGNSSVIATTSNTPVPAGGTILMAVGLNTNIAAITASSTATLTVTVGTGQPGMVLLLGGGPLTLAPGTAVTVNQGAAGAASWLVTTNAPAITPVAPSGSLTLATGGTSQALATAGSASHGCFVYNPATATQQGIATAESAFVNITGGAATTASAGQSIELLPGVPFSCPAGLTTAINWNAATTNHRITSVVW